MALDASPGRNLQCGPGHRTSHVLLLGGPVLADERTVWSCDVPKPARIRPADQPARHVALLRHGRRRSGVRRGTGRVRRPGVHEQDGRRRRLDHRRDRLRQQPDLGSAADRVGLLDGRHPALLRVARGGRPDHPRAVRGPGEGAARPTSPAPASSSSCATARSGTTASPSPPTTSCSPTPARWTRSENVLVHSFFAHWLTGGAEGRRAHRSSSCSSSRSRTRCSASRPARSCRSTCSTASGPTPPRARSSAPARTR